MISHTAYRYLMRIANLISRTEDFFFESIFLFLENPIILPINGGKSGTENEDNEENNSVAENREFTAHTFNLDMKE